MLSLVQVTVVGGPPVVTISVLSLVQVTVVGGPPVVTQAKVNVGGSVIDSSGSN